MKKSIVSLGLALFFLASPVCICAKEAINAAQVSKDFTQAAKKAIPAVVSIKVEIKEEEQKDTFDLQEDFLKRFFGLPKNEQPKLEIGQGSGFLISQDGLILTNNHVVEIAKRITVQLNDEREFGAKIIGRDPSSDLAVIKIDANQLPFLKLGNSDDLEVGQWVIAIGNPMGLQATLTVGVVSAKGRANLDIARIEDFIQTDAAINRGNSGGPLLNLDAEVIGINTAIVSNAAGGYMGIGFAIPSNLAKTILEQILSKGAISRGFIGVDLQPIDNDPDSVFSLKKIEGALVADVSKNSPAEKGGVKQGDLILKINGKTVETPGTLRNTIALMTPGTMIHLTIKRGSDTKELAFQIGEIPTESTPLEEANEALTPHVQRKTKIP